MGNLAYDYYEVTFSNPNIKTVRDWIRYPSSPVFSKTFMEDNEAFLKVVDPNGISNRERIEREYVTHEERELIGKDSSQLIIKIGTKLIVPVENVKKEGLLTEGAQINPLKEPLYKAQQLAALEADSKYVALTEPFDSESAERLGNVKEIYPDMTVWMWCKGLGQKQTDYEGELVGEGGLINVTRFVDLVSTNVSANGGNFQLSLAPFFVQQTPVGGHEAIPIADISAITETFDQKHFVADVELRAGEGGGYRPIFFHHVVSQNDLVFIRFETLQLEAEGHGPGDFVGSIDPSSLAGHIYDMIGLVDDNNLRTRPNEISLAISGRDLSKLFIEDGCYFYPLELSQGKMNFAGGSQANSSLMQRIVADQAVMYIGLYFNQSITDIFRFVINQLSSIKIAPNSLFLSWGDRRNMRFTRGAIDGWEGQSLKGQSPVDQAAQDQFDQAEILISEERLDELETPELFRKLEEDSDFFKKYKQWISQLYWSGLRPHETLQWGLMGIKFEGTDSYEYNEANQLPPSLQEGMKRYNLTEQKQLEINKMIVDGEKIVDSKPEYTPPNSDSDIGAFAFDIVREQTGDAAMKEPLPGIWSIIKIVVDEQAGFRSVVDSSFSTANGSLLNYLKKACQDPFVELLMDTYGDEYVLTIRKPPTDKASYEHMLKENSCKSMTGLQPNLIIDIEEDVVMEENLQFETEVYSWYHFTPQASFFGSAGEFALQYLPAILLEEYAEIYGSKPFDIFHNYIVNPIDNTSKPKELSDNEKQAFLDYKYLIDSTAYLPFTRKGMISLSIGDRRLKVGNFIRYKRTGEIFRIDGVQQTGMISDNTVDRSTTIQVSRGMVERYILEESNELGISYFNIVQVTVDLEATKYEPKYKVEYKEEKKVVDMTPEEIEEGKMKSSSGFVFTKPLPGFDAYLQHQQGTGGARSLWNKAVNNEGKGVPALFMQMNTRMSGAGIYQPPLQKITILYKGKKKRVYNYKYNDQKSNQYFLENMITYYNDAYKKSQGVKSSIDGILSDVSAKQGVPLDWLRAMAQIESAFGKNKGDGGTYRGVMQISSPFAKQYGYSHSQMYDDRNNITCAAKGMKRHMKNPVVKLQELEAIGDVEPDVDATTEDGQVLDVGPNQKIVTETITEKVEDGYETVPDRENILNVSVHKSNLGFFIKNLQFLGYEPELIEGSVDISSSID